MMRLKSGDTMLRKLALIVAISPAMWLSAAHALGLGEIDVNSHLNQRFSAVIPLTSISSDEVENLLVRLADNDDFSKAGVERTDYLSSLTFQVVNDANNPRIIVSSKQLAREPFLSFLLDVRSSNGRVLREYTVLLDPPSLSQTAAVPAPAASVPVAPKVVAGARPAVDETAPAPAPQAPASTAVAPSAVAVVAPVSAPAETKAAPQLPKTYGPVQAQETFWSIANKLRPNPSVTMDQMLWALYSNNPQAFEHKSISSLLKGSTLKVPSLSAITATNSLIAKAHLEDLKDGQYAASSHSKKADLAALARPPAPAAPAAPVAKAEPAVAPKPFSKPVAPVQALTEKKTPDVVAPPAAVKPVAPPAAVAAKPAPVAAAAVPSTAPAPAPAAEPTSPVEPASPAATAAPVEEPPAAPVQAAAPAAAKTPASSSLMDDWMAPLVAGAIFLILALLGVRFWQKKQAEKDNPAPILTSKASRNLQFWKRAAEAEPVQVAEAQPRFAPPPVPAPPPLPVQKPVGVKPPVIPAAPQVAKPLWDEPDLGSTTQMSSFDNTQALDHRTDALRPAVGAGAATHDFDVASKFEAETQKIDLDTNDPVSEADFHLAYGLYDEAALLLENAAEKNPSRTDIRIKLAETYFRASKPHEFDDVAQSLKPQLDAAEWQKIAIMGSQLLPESALYKGAVTEAALGDSVDLVFDEPSDIAHAQQTQVFSHPATSSATTRGSSSSVLDFKLEDLEATHVAPPTRAAAVASGNTLEFNLSDFDLGKPAAKSAEPKPAPFAAKADDHALEFDLGSFDAEPITHKVEAAPATEDINLDDFDLGELPADSHAISAGDEAGTKLDLARAYVDMGDNDMARSLLNEVLSQGSDEQKAEAHTLIQRLA